MGLIAFLVLGALAGWIGSLIMGTSESQSLVMDIVMGMLGALLGGLVMNAVGASGVTGLNLYSLIVAVFGSAILIWLVHLVRAR